MQTDSNDCLTFHNSLGSTNCGISEEGDNSSYSQLKPLQYRSKFFSEDLIGITYETQSIELDADLDPINEKQDHAVCDSVMKWFERRGVVAGNPEEIWMNVNRELHKRTFEIIQHRSVTCLEKMSSSLLQRRLNRSMYLEL